MGEVSQKEVPGAAPVSDGRMTVVAAPGKSGGTQLAGIDDVRGQTRWVSLVSEQPDSFVGVATMQFEANSPWLQVALEDGRVIRLSSLTGHEQRRFLTDCRTPEQQKVGKPVCAEIHAAAFSPDGRTLASSHLDWIFIWDIASATMRRTFRHPHGHGCKLTFGPDGRTLATSDLRNDTHDADEDTIRLYDVESGSEILALEPSDGRATVMAFSPDGNRLFTGFDLGSGIVWDVRRGQRAARAKD